jgi:hypothetical protein
MGSRLPDIFLSYSRDDQATARLFAEDFEREGFSIWQTCLSDLCALRQLPTDAA